MTAAPTLAPTAAELLDALAVATNAPDSARTMRELVEATGLTEARVRDALRVYQAQGRLRTHKVYRQAIDGRQSQVSAYTIAPARSTKAAKRR